MEIVHSRLVFHQGPGQFGDARESGIITLHLGTLRIGDAFPVVGQPLAERGGGYLILVLFDDAYLIISVTLECYPNDREAQTGWSINDLHTSELIGYFPLPAGSDQDVLLGICAGELIACIEIKIAVLVHDLAGIITVLNRGQFHDDWLLGQI